MIKAVSVLSLALSLGVVGCSEEAAAPADGAAAPADAPANVGVASPASPAGGAVPPVPMDGAPTPMPAPAASAPVGPTITPEHAAAYMRFVAPMMVGRVLTEAEAAQIAADGAAAVRPLLEAWVLEPGFTLSIRIMVETALETSGQQGDIDFDLPGNLAEAIVNRDLPWSTLVTSDTCYDASGAPIACDTGAPYTAGVLTTRGYMMSQESRFNLRRAKAMLNILACRGYPQDEALQPRVEVSVLRAMFQVMSQAEDMTGGFGNGFACYVCHGQFGPQAQPYVRFDNEGMWRADATGIQDPKGQPGESLGGQLAASHYPDPTLAASEASQVFGMQTQNLADVAKVMTDNAVYLPCQVEKVLSHVTQVDEAAKPEPELLDEVVAVLPPAPTMRQIAVATFANERVITTVVGQL